MYQKVLTVQDISCFGQCSMTVALPILSACGLETVILPTAILSNHTAGFKGFTVHDLSEELPNIHRQWQEEGLSFHAVYTGYLGTVEEIGTVEKIMDTMLTEGGLRIIDPAMADNGKLYPAFNTAYVEAMKGLCKKADILLPNITEACYLSGTEYRETYDRAYVEDLLKALDAKTVILTGVSYAAGKTGVVIWENGRYTYYEHEKIANGCHGTGDVYASAFVGALMQGKTAAEAAKIAADYTLQCIRNTQGDADHWYGVKFETALPQLIKELNK